MTARNRLANLLCSRNMTVVLEILIKNLNTTDNEA